MNVLISSAGRRVALLNIFRQALRAVGSHGKVFAADISPLAAAYQRADGRFLVPRCTDPTFLPEVVDACQKHDIRLIVPTIDPELPVYAAAREELASAGIHVAVSSPEIAAIGGDKVVTHEWLRRADLPTVRQATLEEALQQRSSWRFPFIAKPRRGSSAIGVALVRNEPELAALATAKDYVVQEVAPGQEYTIDFWVDGSGRCRSVIPRRRLEVRAGEVSKAATCRHEALHQLAFAVAERLPGRAYGVLNVQIFYDDATNRASIIELNPRFGGGYPLAWEAGARYPEWLIRDLLGMPLPTAESMMAWRSGLTMLRYDEAVFLDGGS